jgi:hypothetical protein
LPNKTAGYLKAAENKSRLNRHSRLSLGANQPTPAGSCWRLWLQFGSGAERTNRILPASLGQVGRPGYLEENAGAVDLKLSDDDVAGLEAALRPEAVSGSRYNEKIMAGVDR